ncbi:hypothetical protein SPRG_04441 [Saprolegnia parasitica CBS 223.65]|uniref:Uncharacterized protein n=1 Tax=Saprolegnia parasitica (strain CBS 223.65) TaxID=695850 RepID=A0A067CMS7_SAPPC|nr:hypothetical protein SPRG_04441 [Saprolegnia parasitica CBS 223.65]KDO30540.1 hypothetical protein SPRG_04441 [Saprolegnia parasitica CBS 223.65]|eukprot:XP_012198755.1 hypothetical protein SPRG_04441 [Saprolegnia parasitica CBS 223.65]
MSYTVDVRVKTGVFGRWVSRCLTLDGQRLSLHDGPVCRAAFDVKSATATPLAPTPVDIYGYRLRVELASGQVLHLEVTSESLRAKLAMVLSNAASCAEYSPPATSTWSRLLSVASSIQQRALPSSVASSQVQVADVIAHVARLRAIRASTSGGASPLALYEHLLALEADYVARHRDNPAPTDSYPHLVYQLDTLHFALGTRSGGMDPTSKAFLGVCGYCATELAPHQVHYHYIKRHKVDCLNCRESLAPGVYYKSRYDTVAFDTPLRDILNKCPHRACRRRWSREDMYRIHLLGDAIRCAGCGSTVAYETYQIALFLQEYPLLQYDSQLTAMGSYISYVRTPRSLPRDGRWSSFDREMDALIRAKQVTLKTFEAMSLRNSWLAARRMIQTHALGAFPVDLVQAMARDVAFIEAIDVHFEYWTHPVVVTAAIRRYEHFMALRRPHLSPTVDVELVWRVHRLSLDSYAIYSHEAINDYYETCAAWYKAYKTPYSSHVPDRAPSKMTRLLAHGDSRFHGVDEFFAPSELQHASAFVHDTSGNKVAVSVIGSLAGTAMRATWFRDPATNEAGDS